MQKCEYSLQFHWIDKGNKDKTMYDLNGPRKLHNWSPNLVFCLMNMQNSNTLLSYLRLHDLHTPDHWLLDMEPVMTILTHVLCQHGEPMQKQKIKQLTWVSNVQTGFFQGIYDTRSEVLRTEKAYSTTKGCSSWNWPNGTYQDHVEAPVDTAFENVKHKHRYIILTPCKECSIVEGRYSVRKGFLGKITPVYVMLHTTPHTTTMKISSILCTIHSVLVAMFYCSTPEPTSLRSPGTRCFASPTLFEATKEARQRQSEATTTWKEQQTGVTLVKSLASLLNHPLYDPHTSLDTD